MYRTKLIAHGRALQTLDGRNVICCQFVIYFWSQAELLTRTTASSPSRSAPSGTARGAGWRRRPGEL